MAGICRLGPYNFRWPRATPSYARRRDSFRRTYVRHTKASTQINFSLTLIASGTVAASSLYTYDPNLVISQVVASTVQADGFDAQYVELFNPTTAPINIGVNVAAHSIKLNATSACGSQRTCQDINLTYVSTYVASGRYYLIANRSSFMVLGTNYNADAYYTDTANGSCSIPPSDWSAPSIKRIIQPGHNGAVWLTDAATILSMP